MVLRSGEASFRVAHGQKRPFVVEAGDTVVQAVGTDFTVRLEDDGSLSVVVAEGVVRVTGPASSPALLRHGEEFVAGEAGSWRAPVEPRELERRLAWREGLIMFNGQRLGDAAAEVSRYGPQTVVIDDPTLARAEFVGAFRVGQAEAFANAAAGAFNAEVIREGDVLHLQRRANSPSY